MPTGPGDVLDLIRAGSARTRAELAELTGLSRMTIAQRVDALRDARLIREAGAARSSGGRRAARLEFNVEVASVVTIAAETTHARVALTNLAGEILTADDVEVAVEVGPERFLATMRDAVDGMLTKHKTPASAVCGIGLAIPGPVDPASGRPSEPPIMPGWDAYPVAEHLADALGIGPVIVENDANAMALAEQTARYPECTSLTFVKVSTGIGTGVVIDGSIYQGVDGGAGDIGHVRLPEHSEALCQCGARGCLAAVASGRAVASELARLGIAASSGRDVGALLAGGQPDALRLTHEAGRLLGEVMATVVCLINPGVLVIGGALASTPLISGLRESLYPLSLPRATRHLDVHLSELGADATTIGMARRVVNHVFAPERVNGALAAR